MSPSSAATKGGDILTISGKNFGPSTAPVSVELGGQTCTVEYHNHTTIQFIVPEGSGSGITVKVNLWDGIK